MDLIKVKEIMSLEVCLFLFLFLFMYIRIITEVKFMFNKHTYGIKMQAITRLYGLFINDRMRIKIN